MVLGDGSSREVWDLPPQVRFVGSQIQQLLSSCQGCYTFGKMAGDVLSGHSDHAVFANSPE